jgi:hypothetical protein
VITTAVESCDVLLALIGDRWLTITGPDGRRRLDNPDDYVRLEIEAALARNVRVIPILVDGAQMPRADELPPSLGKLRRRQALELSPNRFDEDTGRLLRVLDRTVAEAQEQARQDAEETAARQRQVEQEEAARQAREETERPAHGPLAATTEPEPAPEITRHATSGAQQDAALAGPSQDPAEATQLSAATTPAPATPANGPVAKPTVGPIPHLVGAEHRVASQPSGDTGTRQEALDEGTQQAADQASRAAESQVPPAGRKDAQSKTNQERAPEEPKPITATSAAATRLAGLSSSLQQAAVRAGKAWAGRYGTGGLSALGSNRTTPRPRIQYFLLFFVALSLGIGGTIGALHTSQGLANGLFQWFEWVGYIGAIIMFGRAAFRGRVRHRFWLHPPPWLDAEPPSDRSIHQQGGDA